MYCTVHLNNFFLSFPNPLCSVVYYISLQTKPPPGSFLPSNQKKKKKSTSGSSVAVACLLGTYCRTCRNPSRSCQAKRHSVTAPQRSKSSDYQFPVPVYTKTILPLRKQGAEGKKNSGRPRRCNSVLVGTGTLRSPLSAPKELLSHALSHTIR